MQKDHVDVTVNSWDNLLVKNEAAKSQDNN